MLRTCFFINKLNFNYGICTLSGKYARSPRNMHAQREIRALAAIHVRLREDMRAPQDICTFAEIYARSPRYMHDRGRIRALPKIYARTLGNICALPKIYVHPLENTHNLQKQTRPTTYTPAIRFAFSVFAKCSFVYCPSTPTPCLRINSAAILSTWAPAPFFSSIPHLSLSLSNSLIKE